jgi:hypothetical protein
MHVKWQPFGLSPAQAVRVCDSVRPLEDSQCRRAWMVVNTYREGYEELYYQASLSW